MLAHQFLCPQQGYFEIYGRILPPCPICGYPEAKASAEYYAAMGVPANAIPLSTMEVYHD